jgi:hypothetical protein
LPLLPVVIVVAVYCCYFIHSFGTFFCIRPWDWSCLLNGLLLYSPFCCCNLDPYFMLRAFVSIDSINLKLFLTVALLSTICYTLLLLLSFSPYLFYWTGDPFSSELSWRLIYLFFFRIGILFILLYHHQPTILFPSFQPLFVCWTDHAHSQIISMPPPITKNCNPKCRPFGTRSVSLCPNHLLDHLCILFLSISIFFLFDAVTFHFSRYHQPYYERPAVSVDSSLSHSVTCHLYALCTY